MTTPFVLVLLVGAAAAFSPAVAPSRPAVRAATPLMELASATANDEEKPTTAVSPPPSLEAEFESVKAASQVALEMVPAAEELGLAKQSAKPGKISRVWTRAKALVGLKKEVLEAAEELIDDSCEVDQPEVCEDEGKRKAAVSQLGNAMRKTLRLSLFGKATDKELADADDAPSGGDAMEEGWVSRSQESALKRTIEVWGFLAKCGLKVVKAGKTKGTDADVSAAKTAAAEFVRDGLFRLGPTCVRHTTRPRAPPVMITAATLPLPSRSDAHDGSPCVLLASQVCQVRPGDLDAHRRDRARVH